MTSHSPASDAQSQSPRADPPSPAAPLRLSAPAEEVLAARLGRLGLTGVRAVRTHTNQNVMVSLTGSGVLRVHQDYALAPDRILQAIVRFVARGRTREVRLAAKRVLLSWPVSSPPPLSPRRQGGEPAPSGVEGAASLPRAESRGRPEDEPIIARLEEKWAEYNTMHFAGTLRAIPLDLSARMRTRLGHLDYHQRTRQPTRIVLSRRMIRRGPWTLVYDTLLHEMVHQWQAETGRPIDHGAEFRRKAREVGIEPRAVVDGKGARGAMAARGGYGGDR